MEGGAKKNEENDEIKLVMYNQKNKKNDTVSNWSNLF